MLKKILLSGLAIILLAIGYVGYTQYPRLSIISAYSAKKMCSCTFISDRSQESIQAEDLSNGPLAYSSTKIDRANKRVTSSVYGLNAKTAEYRGKLGCVLIQGDDEYNVQFPSGVTDQPATPGLQYPYGDIVEMTQTQGLDKSRLSAAADAMFDSEGAMTNKKTRAVLVLHKDSLVYERYANGYTDETEMLGWSMTKSFMNTWIGMLVQDGKMSIDDKDLFPQWKEDERNNITINNLLHMSAGLEWTEDYTEISPATTMLYNSEKNGEVAANLPLEAVPGKHWEYSSGTSNILSLYLRGTSPSHNDYLKFPHERIFGPLNMKSAVLEVDESGTYIGSSYTYMTARDWARYGTFYLHDGVWNGERLLPEGWVDYTKKVVPASGGSYGAHFWTNGSGSELPDAPHDLFSCNGYEGQRVFIIPSHDLVIVRMGLSSRIDFNKFVSEIVASVEG